MGWRDPEFRKRQREDRRARNVCLQCQAGLADSDDDYCVECAQIRKDARDKFERLHPGYDRSRKTPVSDELRASRARRRKIDYHARDATDLCVIANCPDPPVAGETRCKRHRAKQRASSLKYERKMANQRKESDREEASYPVLADRPH